MTLGQMREEFRQISEEWRSETADEQKLDLADFGDLLGKLDEMQNDSAGAPETIDVLRAGSIS